MSESEVGKVCTIKAFQNSKSNFLVLHEYNLILFRESAKNVYCFDFAYIEDVLHTLKNPFTGKTLPIDFLKDLRYFYKKLMIDGDVYQERIKGEKDWVYADLGWDEATKYCWSEFDSFIRGRMSLSEYTTEIKKKKGVCKPYPEDFLKIALKIKNLFPDDLLKRDKWGVRWHSSYPGIELYYLGTKQPENILHSNNIFNCQFNKPGFNYNMFCEFRSSMDRYIIKFLKDPYNEENLKLFRKTKLSSLKRDKRDNLSIWPIKKKIPETKTKFGFRTLTKYKLYNPNGYEHYSIESSDIKNVNLSIKNLFSGKKIISNEDLDIYHIKTGWVQKDINKIIRDALVYLGQTYKIHLQPKPQYQLYTFKRVFDLINTPKLKGYVDDIKAIVPYTKVLGEKRIPSIVIYPVFGNRNAQKVLNVISSDKDLLEKSEEIGLNIVPRFNHTLNKLTFWASGGGSDKLELNEVGKLDEYLDNRANWAHYLCGDEENLCHIQPQKF